ncbi:excalibur calcium-binding domain-containing protein [Streptomyces sp. NPDC052114]|uniref:excalibur calcium-binding domain-containing protein n=1 Tax=unclassified Streptomyces TaxID=2593676 RepID=UPI003444E310
MGDRQGWGNSWNQGGARPPRSARSRHRLPGPWWLWGLEGVLFVALVSVATVKDSGRPEPAPTVTITEPGPTVTETREVLVPTVPETASEPGDGAGETTQAPAATAESSTPQDVYYENCDEVRAAGAAPLFAGQPGYSSDLDRDGDGVACEPYAGP